MSLVQESEMDAYKPSLRNLMVITFASVCIGGQLTKELPNTLKSLGGVLVCLDFTTDYSMSVPLPIHN